MRPPRSPGRRRPRRNRAATAGQASGGRTDSRPPRPQPARATRYGPGCPRRLPPSPCRRRTSTWPAKPSSHSSVAAGPGQRPQGDRVDHHVLAVVAARGPGPTGAPPRPASSTRRPRPRPRSGRSRPGSLSVHPLLGEVDHDPHAGRRYGQRPRPRAALDTLPPHARHRPARPRRGRRHPHPLAGHQVGRRHGTEVFDVQAPASNGFSNETILCRTRSADGDGEKRLVVRVAPTKHLLFLDAEFSTQYRVMRTLADGGSARPPPAARLVRGGSAVPRRALLHHGPRRGPRPGRQPPLHDGGLGHRGHARAAGSACGGAASTRWPRCTGPTGAPSAWTGWWPAPRGQPGIEQQMAYYRRLPRLGRPGRQGARARVDLAVAASTTSRPRTGDVVLSWGDSRIGNIIWDDFRAAAVLDWEMASLGQPEMDLGWWLYFDRQFSEGLGVPRPAGFGSHEETDRPLQRADGPAHAGPLLLRDLLRLPLRRRHAPAVRAARSGSDILPQATRTWGPTTWPPSSWPPCSSCRRPT